MLTGILYAFAKTEYVPSEPKKIAQEFLQLLLDEKYDEAFTYTTHNKDVGSTIKRLKKRARYELQSVSSKSKKIELRVNSVSPPQSYGNRLRRWVQYRQVEQDQISVDFVISGKDIYLLFEVRLSYNHKKDDWKVIYFQSHAG